LKQSFVLCSVLFSDFVFGILAEKFPTSGIRACPSSLKGVKEAEGRFLLLQQLLQHREDSVKESKVFSQVCFFLCCC